MASRPFDAKYPGRCNECDERFAEGDEIRFNDDDEIVGEDCCGYAYDDGSDW
jgi:hypothetical protein